MPLFPQHAGHSLPAVRPWRAGALAVLAAALVVAPLRAQETTAEGQTHTVKKGDTLWDLAHSYLSDPFLWPEIYRINSGIVEDPHWIYPGEVLKIPGGAQLAVENRVEEQAPEQPVPASPGAPTVFAAPPEGSSLTMSRFGPSATAYVHTAVRPGEVYSAPWVDRQGGPGAKGVVVASASVPGIAQASERIRLSPQERAYITLPKGIVAARGDRFVVFAEGTELDDGSQVMEPTGIVEVERPNEGDVATVRLVEQFGQVLVGQGVLPLDRFTLSPEARPTPLMLGTESKVVWIADHDVLPSVERYVILDATAKDGVKIGDQFTLLQPRRRADLPGTAKRVILPEEPLALAQVVKVTDRGTTAIIVDQRYPGIKEGTLAKLTARMP